jgi:hypothetical protein
MSVTTLDQCLAGMQFPTTFYKAQSGTPIVGTMYSQWLSPGQPSAATTLPTGNLAGQFYTCASAQISGQLRFTPAITSDTFYLSRFTGCANTTGTLILADRIWADSVSGGSIILQNVFSGGFPRSAGVGGGDSSGIGIQLALEVFATLGATANTPKVTYIPQSASVASGGDTATLAYAMPATAALGTFIPFTLKAGDFGVKEVFAYHNMAARTNTGALGIVAYRPLAYIPCSVAGVAGVVDALTGGFPILFPNTVPFLIWMAGTTTAPVIAGFFQYCMG